MTDNLKFGGGILFADGLVNFLLARRHCVVPIGLAQGCIEGSHSESIQGVEALVAPYRYGQEGRSKFTSSQLLLLLLLLLQSVLSLQLRVVLIQPVGRIWAFRLSGKAAALEPRIAHRFDAVGRVKLRPHGEELIPGAPRRGGGCVSRVVRVGRTDGSNVVTDK